MLSFRVLGIGGNALQHADDVHVRFVLHAVPFPVARLTGTILTQHAHFDMVGLVAMLIMTMAVVRVTIGVTVAMRIDHG